MGKETGIGWTTSTFNPWQGCTKVSPGCDNCYAEALDKRWGGDHWGKGMPRKEFSIKHWHEPVRWNKLAQASGLPWMVFCASVADVMDDEAPAGARERLWELIDETPYLTWQLLTKRPHRYNRYLPKQFAHQNVWLGASAENQEFYDVRWPILRIVAADYGCPSWISYEPALGPVSMEEWFMRALPDDEYDDYPNWIIFGGESGADRRPMEQAWAENLRGECSRNGTKLYMKQFSALTPAQGKELIPAHLLIHEFPV